MNQLTLTECSKRKLGSVLNRWRGGRNGRNIVKVNNRVEALEKIDNLL